MSIPKLEPHCGSWVISRRSTGEVIGEFFDRRIVERFDQSKCLIETAAQYLGRINLLYWKQELCPSV
jgi:hypothetical protein